MLKQICDYSHEKGADKVPTPPSRYIRCCVMSVTRRYHPDEVRGRRDGDGVSGLHPLLWLLRRGVPRFVLALR